MHNVTRTLLFVALGLGAGFAISSWLGGRGLPAPGLEPSDAVLERRVAALEQALRQEARQHVALIGELAALREQLTAVEAATVNGVPGAASAGRRGGDAADAAYADRAARVGADGNGEAAGANAPPAGRRQRVAEGFRFDAADADARRLERLVDAGFSPDRAEWINRRTAELRMQALENQYRAARGEDVAPQGSSTDALRAELGDQDYERYLRAVGRSAAVPVREVLAGSPAEQAGLRPGDDIVGYDGERVFDLRDLNRLTLQGRPGEPVAVDVMRDGQPVQLYVPRGPVGITGGRRFGRRP